MNPLQQDLHDTITGANMHGLGFAEIVDCADLQKIAEFERQGISVIRIVPGIRMD